MMVLKIGGSMADRAEELADDISGLANEKIVIVHGGGPQVTKLEKALGREPKYIISKEGFKSRHTDAETMENFVMAVGGGVNASLVRMLRKHNVNAVGVCGASGIVLAKRKMLVGVENGKERIIRDDYSGKIRKIEPGALSALLGAGFVPVVAPIALGEEFEALNVDGDRAAAAIAGALGAERLILFTDVEGFFMNFPNDLVRNAKQGQIAEFQKSANAGMKRKLVAADEALANGVKEVIMCSGLKEKPVSSALSGGGTHFTKQ
ncbi:MAG: [LysW]-aminoadipate kinase [Candidatus ainarchaeum sp.]|nr:[LysW]-aminoadipate kinase [Candidatus ainarchaeum sp.]